MAVTCSRCGTQNPDTNRFCQNCGTPLAAPPPSPAVPVGAAAASPFSQPPSPPAAYAAPATYAAPPAAPPAAIPGPPPYASPYYQPAAGVPQPGIHRTPWVLIIAVIVALVVVMGGVGTIVAFALGNHSSQSAGFQSVSSPSPAVSPSPNGSPSAKPTPGSGNSVSTDGETVTIPAGWSVVNKDSETITLESPNGDGAITIGAGPSNPPQTAQQNKDTMDAAFRQKFPDTKPCPGSKVTNGPLGGANGIFWELCFTLTSGAQSAEVGAPLWVGANAAGTVYYAVLLETEASNMDAFIAESKALLSGGIAWKLK